MENFQTPFGTWGRILCMIFCIIYDTCNSKHWNKLRWISMHIKMVMKNIKNLLSDSVIFRCFVVIIHPQLHVYSICLQHRELNVEISRLDYAYQGCVTWCLVLILHHVDDIDKPGVNWIRLSQDDDAWGFMTSLYMGTQLHRIHNRFHTL